MEASADLPAVPLVSAIVAAWELQDSLQYVASDLQANIMRKDERAE